MAGAWRGAYWGPATHALARLAALDRDEPTAAARYHEPEEEAASVGATLHLERIRADARRIDAARS